MEDDFENKVKAEKLETSEEEKEKRRKREEKSDAV